MLDENFLSSASPGSGRWTVDGDELILEGDGGLACGVIEEGDLSGHACGEHKGQRVTFDLNEFRTKYQHVDVD